MGIINGLYHFGCWLYQVLEAKTNKEVEYSFARPLRLFSNKGT